MYKRKLLLTISLVGVIIGVYFVVNFYQIFFWSNTSFNNEASYLFIDRDDNIDSLELQLNPLLKSVDRFLLAAEKKGYINRIRSGKYKLDSKVPKGIHPIPIPPDLTERARTEIFCAPSPST